MNDDEEKYYFQIIERRRPRYKRFIRLLSKTARDPTPAQMEMRITFGELSRRAGGMKQTGELSPPAEIHKQMKGMKAATTRPREPRKWEIALEDMVRENAPEGDEEEQIRKMRKVIVEILGEEQ